MHITINSIKFRKNVDCNALDNNIEHNAHITRKKQFILNSKGIKKLILLLYKSIILVLKYTRIF